MTKEERDKIIDLFEKYSFKGETRTLHDTAPGSGTEVISVITFEDALKAIEGINKKRVDMTFGEAIEEMRNGERVARKGWNGKGMYIFLTHEDKLNTGMCDHIDMKAADNSIVIGWLASQTDILATDWVIVPSVRSRTSN